MTSGEWQLLIGYLVFLVAFYLYSKMAMRQLSDYGYKDDFCKKMEQIYRWIAITIVVVTMIFFIL